jgi:signal transduction histidine kinase
VRACVRRTHRLRSTTFRQGLLTTVDDVLSEPSELRQQHQVKGLEAVREVVELRMHEEAINRAAREIMRGDLARRVPTTGRGGEVDELAGELNAMLAGLIAQERQVTDDIAHDLRTPLARLRQRLELARSKVRSVGEYKQAVDGTIEAADATIATFASLLRIAEVEAGMRRSAFRVLDLSRTAEKVAVLHARAQVKG